MRFLVDTNVLIAALMAEHDVRRIHTFDTHFRRFSHLEVIVPGADG